MKVCVIVPAYNAARYLPETVQSVQNQTEGDWELIVVNDGSRDDTGLLAERLAAEDPRIRVVHQANAAARRRRPTLMVSCLCMPTTCWNPVRWPR